MISNDDPFKKVRGTKLAELCPPPSLVWSMSGLNGIFRELYSDTIPDNTALIAKPKKKK